MFITRKQDRKAKEEKNPVKAILKEVAAKKVSLSRVINYTIITSEHQTAIGVAETLTRVLPAPFHSLIQDKLKSLEQESRNELMMAFNVATVEKQLEKTPIYPDEDMELMFKYYLLAADYYNADTFDTGMRVVGLIRKQSSVTYLANAPVFKVAEFLAHPEYQELLTNESITDEFILLMHETLLFVFLLDANDYNIKLNTNKYLYNSEVLDTLELDDVRPN